MFYVVFCVSVSGRSLVFSSFAVLAVGFRSSPSIFFQATTVAFASMHTGLCDVGFYRRSCVVCDCRVVWRINDLTSFGHPRFLCRGELRTALFIHLFRCWSC